MKPIQTIKSVLLLCCIALTFAACEKHHESAHMTVKMHDDPGDYQQVNIEVRSVMVNHESHGWIFLDTEAGIYDLLELQNGISAILVDGNALPAGYISQMRLVLGSNNSVMVDSVLYQLDTPSAETSGLKLKIDHEFEPGFLYELEFDFSVEKSIVEKGNGGYALKPVLTVDHVIEL